MPLCWSCEKDAGVGVFCVHCQAILPANGARDAFATLGLPRSYEIDLTATERIYKERAVRVHPDKFARADPRARRAALSQTVALNDAWRILKDPARRAEHLLNLSGVSLDTEVAAPALLGEVMELREALMDARHANDSDALKHLGTDVRVRRDESLATVAAGLSHQPIDLAAAAQAMVALRYWLRFLEELDAHEDAGQEPLPPL